MKVNMLGDSKERNILRFAMVGLLKEWCLEFDIREKKKFTQAFYSPAAYASFAKWLNDTNRLSVSEYCIREGVEIIALGFDVKEDARLTELLLKTEDKKIMLPEFK
jgi:hypothetical protein